MKLYCALLYQVTSSGGERSAKRLSSSCDLSSFGFFQQNNIREFMHFSGKMLAEKTEAGCRISIKEQNYLSHVYSSCEGVTGVLISDDEYPSTVALSIVAKFTNDFAKRYPKESLANWTKSPPDYKDLDEVLVKYQNPAAADSLQKLQQDVDDTKEIMYCNLESLLQRDEKLDDLIAQSEELTLSAKAFYVTAKKTNKCCALL